MIFTPVLRKGITCFGEDTCYAVGFGFPAILMLIATCMFENCFDPAQIKWKTNLRLIG